MFVGSRVERYRARLLPTTHGHQGAKAQWSDNRGMSEDSLSGTMFLVHFVPVAVESTPRKQRREPYIRMLGVDHKFLIGFLHLQRRSRLGARSRCEAFGG